MKGLRWLPRLVPADELDRLRAVDAADRTRAQDVAEQQRQESLRAQWAAAHRVNPVIHVLPPEPQLQVVHGPECRDSHTRTLERRLAVMQGQLDAAMGYDSSTERLLDSGRTVPRTGTPGSAKPGAWVTS